MKKFLTVFLLLLSVFLVTSCDKDDKKQENVTYYSISGEVSSEDVKIKDVEIKYFDRTFYSDANGEYNFIDILNPTGVLIISKQSFETQYIQISQNDFDENNSLVLNIELKSVGLATNLVTLEGVVLSYGNPISGALVSFDGMESYSFSNGEFRFRNLVAKTTLLTIFKEGYLPSTIQVNESDFAGGVLNVNVSLVLEELDYEKATIEGIVKDADGNKIDGAAIKFLDNQTSSVNGEFVLVNVNKVPGCLVISADGFITNYIQIFASDYVDGTYFVAITLISDEAIPETLEINGLVTFNGIPLSGTTVSYNDSSTYSLQNGRYSLKNVKFDNGELVFERNTFFTRGVKINVTDFNEGVLTVDIELSKSKVIKGNIKEFYADVYTQQLNDVAGVLVKSGDYFTLSDENGNYELEVPFVDDFFITYSKDGFSVNEKLVRSFWFDINGNYEMDTVHLMRRATLFGVVKDANGNLLYNVKVVVGSAVVYTDINGYYFMDEIFPQNRNFQVEFTKYGYFLNPLNVNFVTGNYNVELNVTMAIL